MRLQLLRDNIERYERLLESEFDPVTRQTLQSLLAEARAEECLILEERALESGDNELWDAARRWRLRAAEYRGVADAMHNSSARQTYVRLAQNYEQLAERAEARASRRGNPMRKADHE
jgi:hypothetical protein